MAGMIPFVAALLYAALLFAFASWAEAGGSARLKAKIRLPAYVLAIGVYCTSWTFYGAVGAMVQTGWDYVPIYLGPILVFAIGGGFLKSLILEVKADGANSISEFISGRFGASRVVAALVTLLALLGSVPYLALQLRSLASSFIALSGAGDRTMIMGIAAIMLALWAMIYGTRRYEAAGRNDAVVFAVGFESIFKIIALMVVGFLALGLLIKSPAVIEASPLHALKGQFAFKEIGLDFFILTILSMVAIIALPRQFYMGVIEARSERDIEKARLPFIVYMLITLMVVIPIGAAGVSFLRPEVRPDSYVLILPLSQGQSFIAHLVFLGGFAAATGMVLVETIALSTMVSNDLVAPNLLRLKAMKGDYSQAFLIIRRVSIGLIMAAALLWALTLKDSQALASIGIVAFAAIAQFAPHLLLSVYRKRNDPLAAKVSLFIGLCLWFYTLALPQILPNKWFEVLQSTPFNPHGLFGFDHLSPISHGLMVSLGANLAALWFLFARSEKGAGFHPLFLPSPEGGLISHAKDLKLMVARFVGFEAADKAFVHLLDHQPIDGQSARRAESLIATVVGRPSARALISSALFGAKLSPFEVSRLLDETGQSLKFSKNLLAATLEHIDPGVSVVDRDLQIVAWNSRYLALFGYPDGMVYVGAPVADLIRYNLLQLGGTDDEIEAQVQKRLMHMHGGQAHSFERVRPDGRVIKTVGGPMPMGGYVMCFTDITNEAQALAAVQKARAELESRVESRTSQLREANLALARADSDKTRFLAAASHDLLQPLHAARLFSAALNRGLEEAKRVHLLRLDRSIEAAEQLLRALLDISKLDAGGVVPDPKPLAVRALLMDLTETMAPLAQEKGLTLKLGAGSAIVETDMGLLKSIVQNLISNAIRYSHKGRIVVGVRRMGSQARIDVIDQGPGIDPQKHEIIFKEFERLNPVSDHSQIAPQETGIGLGLAIVERTARLLGAQIKLSSKPGLGSRFSVILPIAGLSLAPLEAPHEILGKTHDCLLS